MAGRGQREAARNPQDAEPLPGRAHARLPNRPAGQQRTQRRRGAARAGMMAASLRVGGRVMSGSGAPLAACAVTLAPLAVVVPLALGPLFLVTAATCLALDLRGLLSTLRRFAPLAWLLLLLTAWATVSASWSILPL